MGEHADRKARALLKPDAFIERERAAYFAQPAEWKEANRGRFAVFKDGELIGVFEDSRDAVKCGVETFRGERYFIQIVGNEDEPVDLLPTILSL